MNYDVAIIGGGPGGATVGALLKKYNPFLDVIILERDKFPRDHVGESQLPALSQILAEMGAWDRVEAANFPIKIGATYRWGATDELWDLDFLAEHGFRDEPRPAKFEGQRAITAFQVDRSIYDQILLDIARDHGCEVREETRVTSIDHTGDSVLGLKTAGPGGSDGQIGARWYVDCSGEAGTLRRALTIPVEEPTLLRNVAFWDYWHDAEWAVSIGNGGTRIQIMSLGWGWLWFIPITPTRTSVGLVVPADYFKQTGKRKEQLYLEAIAADPLISHLLAHATQEGNVQGTKDWSFLAARLVGDNWFLAGDSCGFADPILSAGLTLAQTSARKVAYSILEMDRGNLEPGWIRDSYNNGHRRHILHHMQFADYWYSANGCFTDLKALCREIALSAGLDLDADNAFRWLSTGGFALEAPGIPQAGSCRVLGVKLIAERLGGSHATWELTRTNSWRLDFAAVSRETFASYERGQIVPVPALRIGEKLLPAIGVYKHVLDALARETDGVSILEHCVNAMLQAHECEVNIAPILVAEAIEALIAEGWLQCTLNPNRPLINLGAMAATR